MKNYKELGIYDFSDYAEEITGEELIKINGGYVKRELEGCSPLGVDGNFGYLPFSAAIMTDEEGFNGGSITFGPGMGVSSSVQNSYTLSINNIATYKIGKL